MNKKTIKFSIIIIIFSLIILTSCSKITEINASNNLSNISCDDKDNCTEDFYDKKSNLCMHKTKENCCNNCELYESKVSIVDYGCEGSCYKSGTLNINGTSDILIRIKNDGNKDTGITAYYKCFKVNAGVIVFGGYGFIAKDYFIETGSNEILLKANSTATYKINLKGNPTASTEISCKIKVIEDSKEQSKNIYLLFRQ
ncbi:hypothetical protein J4440_02600 [Candidatus Woesearchaeota archaeon]|nr:hypothetical protein [Candidatus Woesearchaeota archaeon]